MKIQLAARMSSIRPFHVMDLLGRAKALERQGRNIIHLEVGEPDFNTPEPVIEAAQAALKDQTMHYTPSTGLPALKENIAAFYADRYQAIVDPEQIVVTTGASAALIMAFGALLGENDAVMLSDPGYPCNRNFAHFLGVKTCSVETGPQTAYQLTTELIENHWQDNVKAVLIASPANPTGTLIPRSEMLKIIETVRRKNAWLIVDEIYQGLVYDSISETTAGLSDNVIVINSFSKYFHMTGWRIGWMVLPYGLVQAMDHLAQNLYLAPPTLSQYAALAVFTDATREIIEERVSVFRERRDYFYPAMQALGFRIPVKPQGAFYLYADCSAFTTNSQDFCNQLLEKAGVAITPGVDFGEHQAQTHVRLAYTRDLSVLQQAVKQLESFISAAGY